MKHGLKMNRAGFDRRWFGDAFAVCQRGTVPALAGRDGGAAHIIEGGGVAGPVRRQLRLWTPSERDVGAIWRRRQTASALLL